MTEKEWIIKYSMPDIKNDPPGLQDKLIKKTIGGQMAQSALFLIALVEFSFGDIFKKLGLESKQIYKDARKVVEDKEG